jgi:hypothetical protein
VVGLRQRDVGELFGSGGIAHVPHLERGVGIVAREDQDVAVRIGLLVEDVRGGRSRRQQPWSERIAYVVDREAPKRRDVQEVVADDRADASTGV